MPGVMKTRSPADSTLAQRVDALPAEVGTIVKLRFYEELSLKEISAVTGVPLSTVKTRLYTGLKKTAGNTGKRGMMMNEFEKAREDYEQIPIPAELEERVQAGIRQGQGGTP